MQTVYSEGKQISGFQEVGWGGRITKEHEKTSVGDGYVHYFD